VARSFQVVFSREVGPEGAGQAGMKAQVTALGKRQQEKGADESWDGVPWCFGTLPHKPHQNPQRELGGLRFGQEQSFYWLPKFTTFLFIAQLSHMHPLCLKCSSFSILFIGPSSWKPSLCSPY
jgi:hypothetical protein